MIIGIICAMYQEYVAIKNVVELSVEHKHGEFILTTGYIAKVQIALIYSGVGKIRAALATYKLINENSVDLIIITGFSGSLSNRIKVGDIFIASEVLDNASYIKPRTPLEISNRTNRQSFITDKRTYGLINEACRRFVHEEKSAANKMKFCNIMTGTLVTSDVPVYDCSYIKAEIKEKYGDLCVDMESSGVYYTCSLYAVPCVSLRIISDMANKHAPVYILRALFRATSYMGNLVYYIISKIAMG